ncbi:ricin-type beta-trefoil lectin domain protein [Crossiella sp. CA-258035]|uniref:RICIN domain-containing protein n=1 Tax=Crossiella sp. CA-258035 TaxID=2981138 RepID=UPI0024BD5801|nr:RICIN domain-containing protein [Crossiella sp. CA-258035]WHT23050.1 ricin-type beta-trefoil lectin domain protein [Crossiella sp. CA-258035]
MRRRMTAAALALGLSGFAIGVVAPVAQAAPAPAFQIQSLHNGGCLTVDDADNVRMTGCDPGGFNAHQMWKIDGEKIRSALNGRCLDVKHGQVNGAVQATGACHNHANQRWQWNGDIHANAFVRTLSTLQVMGIEDGGGGGGINMRDEVPGAAWQKWKQVVV